MEGLAVSGFSQGFDEPEEGLQIKARLKWFNATKGFGFVSPVDGASDAFLHVSVLHRAGLQHLGDQAELLCEVGPGPKGPQVLRIVEVLDPGQPAGSSQASGGRSDGAPYGRVDGTTPKFVVDSNRDPGYDGFGHSNDGGPEEQLSGIVKWFKPEKGFGFITADGSGSDVFIHKSVLQRSGLFSLEAGQRVQMRVHEVEKGREATWVAAD